MKFISWLYALIDQTYGKMTGPLKIKICLGKDYMFLQRQDCGLLEFRIYILEKLQREL